VGALLAKVYGVASMKTATLAVALPFCVGLILIWAGGSGGGNEDITRIL
jgi:hypothetical protein